MPYQFRSRIAKIGGSIENIWMQREEKKNTTISITSPHMSKKNTTNPTQSLCRDLIWRYTQQFNPPERSRITHLSIANTARLRRVQPRVNSDAPSISHVTPRGKPSPKSKSSIILLHSQYPTDASIIGMHICIKISISITAFLSHLTNMCGCHLPSMTNVYPTLIKRDRKMLEYPNENTPCAHCMDTPN